MPISDFTSKLLELEDVFISDVSVTNTEVHVFFSLKRKPHTCPHCQTLTDKVHDYRISVIKDLPLMGKRSFLHYRKRRYHCPTCGKHFYESFSLLPKHCRITTRMAFYSLHLLSERQSVRSVSRLLGVSDSFVFRRLRISVFQSPNAFPLYFLLMNLKEMQVVKNFRQSLHSRINTVCLISSHPVPRYRSCSIFRDFQTKKRSVTLSWI